MIEQACLDGFESILLETQNTNVGAVRFYRAMGFSLVRVELDAYPEAPEQVRFDLKRKV